jgi:hypothetical protein
LCSTGLFLVLVIALLGQGRRKHAPVGSWPGQPRCPAHPAPPDFHPGSAARPAARRELLTANSTAAEPTAKPVLYPDAGHAFLFQDAVSFVPTVDAFIHRAR